MIYGSMIPKELVPKRQIRLANVRHESMRFFNIYIGMNKSAEELGIKDYAIFVSDTMDSVKDAESLKFMEGNNYNVFVCYNTVNPDFSPEGTCAITLLAMFRSDIWADVPVQDYFKKKEEYARQIIEAFERQTGIRLMDNIEEIEIATPWTFAR